MNDAEVRQAFDPLYADIKPEAQFFNAQPLLAHYTTIQTIEQIVRSKQMWFSNPLYMNDIEEVGFGLIEGESAITSSQALSDACGTPSEEIFSCMLTATTAATTSRTIGRHLCSLLLPS